MLSYDCDLLAELGGKKVRPRTGSKLCLLTGTVEDDGHELKEAEFVRTIARCLSIWFLMALAAASSVAILIASSRSACLDSPSSLS